jgi:putative heme-binding domain-containing protein
MNRIYLISIALAAGFAACGEKGEPVLEGPFQVPAGFVVEPAAKEDVGSLVQVTFDAQGRPVVSKERAHPTMLLDSDGDGTFETEKTVSDQVNNCQGLWYDGPTLYCIGDNLEGQAGMHALPDTDGDGVADSIETLVLFTGPMGEHGPHDMRRGPDGIPTVLLGNHTFVPQEQIDPTSPLENYNEAQLLERYWDARGHAVNRMAPGGALFRVDREKKMFKLLLGGFRNPYNHAYNIEGEAFTFDSDMEWDINLPWYRDVRSVHAVPAGDYGWRSGSGKLPAYYLDSLPPVDDLGRGSPVGVEFYQHYAYPAEYLDGFLQGDWSRGRVVFSKFVNAGATYEVEGEPFDFVYGEPLNVTDLEVGPDGLIYFTMGGRDTQGGFYRVSYKGHKANWDALPKEGVLAAVRQPQPLSAWGQAALEKKRQEMGDAWGTQLQAVALDANAEWRDRVSALYLLQRFTPRPDAILLGKLLDDKEYHVRAAAAYVVGLHGSDRAKALAARSIKDAHPLVQRRGAEALVRMGLSKDASPFAPVEDIYALLGSQDRFVRWAGRIALEHTPREQWKALAEGEKSLTAAPEAMLALSRTALKPIDFEPVYENSLSMLKQPGLSPDDELRLMRAFQVACVDSKGGCRESLRSQVYDIVAPRFPAQDERLNREYARTMAYSGRPEAITEIMAAMPRGDDNTQLQVHYVYCLREIKKGWTPEQKDTLVAWFEKAREWRGGASYPGFINRLFDSSLEFFTADEKKMAYQRIPEYAPITDEEVLARLRRRGDYTPANVFARQQGQGSSGVSEKEIEEYLMYDPMTTKADPHDGKKIFEDQCAKCHRFGDLGKDYGPDLTTINNRFKRRDMVEAVLYPSKTISDQYDAYRIRVGYEVFEGLIADQDETSVTVMLPEEERPVKFEKAKVEIEKSDVSIMPTGLLDGYSTREIATLFAYLQQGPNLPAKPASDE